MSDEKTTAIEVVLTPEMNQAIAMADRKPRSIPAFIKESVALVTMDETTAEDCLYALPRTETDPITGKKEKKTIEGPSARLAEIINYQWGNCRAEGKITDDRGEFVTAQGTFVDLEKNSGVRTEVRRRITTRRGDRYSADMIMQTGNAAISIARRNAILAGIPKVFWSKIYEAARQTVAGDSQTLINRRGKAIAHMQKLGVTVEMIIEALGVQSTEDIGLDHLVTLRGIATAIREGETTVEEAFSKKDAQQPAGDAAADQKNKNAPKPGATTAKAKSALKGSDKKGGLDEQSLTSLRSSADKAGVAENALIEKFQVESLEVMTREQYEEAMRYVAGVIADNAPPAQ
jgi:hypothetical protein